MRVPDPPQPDLGERIASASKGKGMMIAGAVIALLVAVGLALALSRGGNEAPAAPRGASAPPPPATRAPAPVAPSMLGTPLPSPTATPRPSPTPSAPPSPSPSPSARPSPVVSVAPPEAMPPAPAVVHPEVEESPPPDEEDRDPAPVPSPLSSDVSGQWDLSNRVVATDYAGFRGLNLGYRITLRQSGSRISGSGVKVTENGTPSNRTPITVSGRIEGSNVVLTFTEQGTTRTSAGTFRWQLSPDGSSLRGSFWSDAANTNGPSSARRIP